MIEFHLRNPFRNTELGHKRFLKYATVHLERLRAAAGLPTALATDRVAATETAILVFREQVKGGAQQGATRQGKTIGNDAAIRKFQQYVSQQAKILGALFTDLDKEIKGVDTAAYKAFFPKGVLAITQANKAELDTEASVFLKATTDYQAQVGAALGTKARTLWQAVEDSRQQQLASMGTEEGTQDARDTARLALADELFLNLLALLTHHYQAPGKVYAYFPEAILKENTGKNPRPVDVKPGA